MRITKLSVENFGKFSNTVIELKDGVNVLYGYNESGKSTISAFIFGMLFGIRKERDGKSVDLYGRYLPWNNSEQFSGSMEFIHEGTKYRLIRNFLQNRQSTRLINLNTGKELYDGERAFRELFPDLNAKEYLSTYFYTDGMDKPDSGIVASLKKHASGTKDTDNLGVDIEYALRILDEKRREFIDSKSHNKLEELERTIAIEEKTEKKLDLLAAEELEGMSEIDKLNIELEKVNTPSVFEEKEKDYYTYKERYATYKKDLEQSRTMSEELEHTIVIRESLEEYGDKKEQLKEELETIRSFARYNSERTAGLKKELEAVDRLNAMESHTNRVKQICAMGATIFLALMGIVFLIAGLNIGFAILAFIMAAAACAIFIVLTLRINREGVESREKIQEIKDKLDSLEREKELFKKTHSSEREVVERYETCLKLEGRLPEILEKENSLSETLERIERDLSKRKNELMKFFTQFGMAEDIKDDELALQEKALVRNKNERLKKVAEIKSRMTGLSEKMLKLHMQIEAGEENEEHLLKHREERKKLKEELKMNEREAEAIVLAEKIIEELASENHKSIGVVLNEKASEYAAAFTGRKYTSFIADDKLDCKVDSYNKYVSLDDLSRGTNSQMNLALRMSAGKILMEDYDMPLIFDESFVYYDDERLARTLDRLTRDDKQILIFTCQSREETILSQLAVDYNIVNL